MLQSLDLEYHNVDPEAWPLPGPGAGGRVRRVVSDDEIARAVTIPPAASPRAIVRGLAVAKFAEAVKQVTWSRLTLDDGSGQSVGIRMSAVQDLDPARVMGQLKDAATPAEFVRALEALEHDAGTDAPADAGDDDAGEEE